MRWLLSAVCVSVAVLASNCQSDGGGPGGGADIRLPERGTLFMKVFNEDPSATGPADVQVTLDGEKILDRNFTMDEKSYDGQYQIKLPKGKHVLQASTEQGAVFTSKAFTLKDKAFVQIYVTEDKKFRLTKDSRRSLARLVIKRMRASRGVNSDPALWMIVPAPQASSSTRDAVKKNIRDTVKKNFTGKTSATDQPAANQGSAP